MVSVTTMQPYVVRLAERYLKEDVKIGFDAFLTLVSENCPSIRHLESFLKSSKSVKDLQKAKQKKFFATWQEAAEVVRKAGVRSQREYRRLYKEIDPHLPVLPHDFYSNFPGWGVFLETSKFETWQEASEVCIAFGITGYTDYLKRYRQVDTRLPASLRKAYPDFPGWDVFLERDVPLKLDRDYFETWQEASEVCIAIGITGYTDYFKRYRQVDMRLPASLRKAYPDFPGMDVFLDKLKYKTWQESSRVARSAKIASSTEYGRRYKEVDHRLPSDPNVYYDDFPGWYEFLGKEKPHYFESWQEASRVAIRAGVVDSNDYRRRHNEIDSRLHPLPSKFYPEFPGWDEFLKKRITSWEEASLLVREAGVTTSREYQNFYKEIDPGLPRSPRRYYSDFPGWDKFLGREEKSDSFKTWQEASKVAIAGGIRSAEEYKRKRESVSKSLPACPDAFYQDWPGWVVFLQNQEKYLYKTWEEASRASKNLGLADKAGYYKRGKSLDARLPKRPQDRYEDFPGWSVFLGISWAEKSYYDTWQEASKVAVQAGISSRAEYCQQHLYLDACLPGCPRDFYSDFPGWDVFLGKSPRTRETKEMICNKYPNWQDASLVAIEAGIVSSLDYWRRRVQVDGLLPKSPHILYEDFPGWDVFLGKYGSWQESSRVAIASGINNKVQYIARYASVDRRLPPSPDSAYDDFPGWNKFLGKNKYPTWQEASMVAIAGGLKNQRDYYRRYKDVNPRLPSKPDEYYSNFPGYRVFLNIV